MMIQDVTIDINTDINLDNEPEPNLVRAMSPRLTPSSKQNTPRRALSSIFGNKKALELAEKVDKEYKNNSAFPEKYQYSGYLSTRTDDYISSSWKRQYFVLSNNFLFGADNKYSTQLSICIPLEGSNKKLSIQSSDMTFELNKYQFRAGSPQLCSEWLKNIERASKLKIRDLYRFRYELGCSASSNTKVKAAKHKITHKEYAIKIMNKKKCNDKKTLQREIQILKKLKSPFIVELCDLFETRKYLYIVMEMCKGGELFDQIANMDYSNGDRYTEKDIIGIMHQLASGVQYMHDMGIVHRDLKPENILCVEANSIKKIKIADFGISAIIDQNRMHAIHRATSPRKHFSQISASVSHSQQVQNMNNMMSTQVGTLSYIAPEVLKCRPYDERVDYWSLGVIMYILVCGYPPFEGDNEYDLCDEIINEPVEFDQEDWCHVGKNTRDLIDRLLAKKPRRRANCQDIIEHSWKIDVKNSGFLKAHNNLKLTVFRRKIGYRTRSRANTFMYDENENKTPTPKQIKIKEKIKERMEKLQLKNINSLDDSVLKFKRIDSNKSTSKNLAIGISQFASEQKENQIEAWSVGNNTLKSKGMECLSLQQTDSNRSDFDGFVMDDPVEDFDFPVLDLFSYSNNSNKSNKSPTYAYDFLTPSTHSPQTSGQTYSQLCEQIFKRESASRSAAEFKFTNKRESASAFKRSGGKKSKNNRSRKRTQSNKRNKRKYKQNSNNLQVLTLHDFL